MSILHGSLSLYLEQTRGITSNEYEILEDDLEKAGRYFDGNQYIITYPELVETGYRLAKVETDGGTFTVKYSPSLDDAIYPYGGLDNFCAKAIDDFVVKETTSILEDNLALIQASAGERLWSGEILQSYAPSIKDLSTIVPRSGLLNVQLVFNDGVSLECVQNATERVSKYLLQWQCSHLIDGLYHIENSDQPQYAHIYYSDGAAL